MPYPKANFRELADQLSDFAALKHERGAKNIDRILAQARRNLQRSINQLQALPADPKIVRQTPNSLAAIRKLRPAGPRRIWKSLDPKTYRDRLEGAFLARCAGNALGAIVELWSPADMQKFAQLIGDNFPPADYWTRAGNPHHLRYGTSYADEFTRPKMNGVPVDDDIIYTLLGLLIIEDFGPNFTTQDVGKAWLKYLPHACTAEKVALDNLRKKVPAARAAVKDNPFTAWIGADIRSDPWGYLAPGWPERAAEMAYRDACISHREEGIYGEMFFSAAIAAAFALDDPMDSLDIALTEIPAQCATAKAVRWALKLAPKIKNHKHARAAVDDQFPGMHPVHTINNACLTIFGLAIGGANVTRVISQTVAMGLDNDCTAATAGSIVGAVVGKSGVPPHWHKPFHNTVHSYLINRPKFKIDDILRRFQRAARLVAGQSPA